MLTLILVAMFIAILLIPTLFPIEDVGVDGFLFRDIKSNKWVVCLTDRSLPVTFNTEAEAKEFLDASITYPVGGNE